MMDKTDIDKNLIIISSFSDCLRLYPTEIKRRIMKIDGVTAVKHAYSHDSILFKACIGPDNSYMVKLPYEAIYLDLVKDKLDTRNRVLEGVYMILGEIEAMVN